MSAAVKPYHSIYEFLLALNVGESHRFDNKPTRSEAIRKIVPSKRSACCRIRTGVAMLAQHNPGHKFTVVIGESKGSRIPGNVVDVTLIARGDTVMQDGTYEASEKRRQASIDAWRRKKVAEDAPKLPGELEKAEAIEVARRTAGAIRHQQEVTQLKLVAQRYDPKKIAQLVAASIRGEVIEKLVDDRWLIDPAPTWEEPTGHYRIKPKIREWFLVLGRDGRVTASAENIQLLPHHDPDCRVRVREVLEDEA